MLFHVARTGCLLTESYTVTPQTMNLPQTPTRPTALCRAGGIIAASAGGTAHYAEKNKAPCAKRCFVREPLSRSLKL